jgi:antitoxin PrlF
MSCARLTSKGQITIPVSVRRDLNLSTGDRVEFVWVAPGRCELVASTREVGDLKGMFGPAKKRVGVEDMNAAIAARGAKAS